MLSSIIKPLFLQLVLSVIFTIFLAVIFGKIGMGTCIAVIIFTLISFVGVCLPFSKKEIVDSHEILKR